MKRTSVGLLPLYIKLYDEVAAGVRPRMNKFAGQVAAALQKQGVDVTAVPVCRVKSEFKKAIDTFEKVGVDAIVTLHLAYSPSLESSSALAGTKLPVIVLDTTPTFDYGPAQDPAELMYNHGIHGVQDMCNLLIRNGKSFEIAAGHWQKSAVIAEVAALARAAHMAKVMKTARVGIIGKPFDGMGDFAVPAQTLKKTVGVETVSCNMADLKKRLARVSKSEIGAEASKDRVEYRIGKASKPAMERSIKLGLALRGWMEKERLNGFTMNFLDMNREAGMPTVPFLEAAKAMARGQGYAGEGDVLTAALVASLMSVHADSSFTEMFCPDWKGNSIFLSHMGEVNPGVLSGKAVLTEMDYSFSDADNPIRALGCFKSGRAVFVNLAPLAGNKYRLIVVPVHMKAIGRVDRMKDSVHGWFSPAGMKIDKFLKEYSRLGGTHHAALVYGDVADEIAAFGRIMGWETRTIQ